MEASSLKRAFPPLNPAIVVYMVSPLVYHRRIASSSSLAPTVLLPVGLKIDPVVVDQLVVDPEEIAPVEIVQVILDQLVVDQLVIVQERPLMSSL